MKTPARLMLAPLLGWLAGCSGSASTPIGDVDAGAPPIAKQSASTVKSGEGAQALVGRLRSDFRVRAADGKRYGIVPPGAARGFDVRADGIAPRLDQPGPTTIGLRRATARLPLRASAPFRVEAGKAAIAVRMLGTEEVEASLADDAVVYPAALAGADVVHVPTAMGTEEFVHFRAKPAKPEVRYQLALEHAAGLRLVEGVLEVLDADGDPLFHTTAPTVVDANGEKRIGTIAVEGCAFDADARPPWGRKPIEPGAATCTVVTGWPDEGLQYPVLVDPAWTSAGTLANKRNFAAAAEITTTAAGYAACAGGCVVVAGGYQSGSNLSSTEIYREDTGAFATVKSMNAARLNHAAGSLGATMVVAGGNLMSGPGLSSAELYDPSTAAGWTSIASMPGGGRHNLRGIGLAGHFYAVGGVGTAGNVGTVEEYFGGAWISRQAMTPRGYFALTGYRYGNTNVLFAAGANTAGGSVFELVQHDTSSGTFPAWSSGATYPTTLLYPALALTSANTAILMGGFISGGRSADIFKWAVGGGGSATKMGALPIPRGYGEAAAYGTGVLAIGGSTGLATAAASKTADFVDSSGVYQYTTTMSFARSEFNAVTLKNGKVLVVGGFDYLNDVHPTNEELFQIVANGGGCTSAVECASGLCVDGTCCDRACGGQCEACNLPATKGTCTTVTKTNGPAGYAAGQAVTGFGTTRTGCSAYGTTCGFACDGSSATACTAALPATICSAASCVGGIETRAANCNGSGACLSATTAACGNYGCGATACKTSCATPADCVTGYTCNAATHVCEPSKGLGSPCSSVADCTSGSCVDGTCCSTSACAAPLRCDVVGAAGSCKLPLGEACTTGASCGSGFCVDGVCCNAACDGQCEACDGGGTKGVCSAIKGAPHGTRTACSAGAGNVCRALTCDGADHLKCAAFAAGLDTECAPAACADGTETAASFCDNAGSCKDGGSKTCAPFACGATSCKKSCAGGADCATGYNCDAASAKCVPARPTCAADFASSISADKATTKPCVAYVCNPASGDCFGACTGTDQCASGFVCDGGACVAATPTAPTAESGGCSTGPTGRSAAAASALLFGLVLAARRVRRRG